MTFCQHHTQYNIFDAARSSLQMNLVELQTIKSSSTTFRQSHGGSGGAWPMTSLAIDELTLLKGLKNTPHSELAQKNLPFMF